MASKTTGCMPYNEKKHEQETLRGGEHEKPNIDSIMGMVNSCLYGEIGVHVIQP